MGIMEILWNIKVVIDLISAAKTHYFRHALL